MDLNEAMTALSNGMKLTCSAIEYDHYVYLDMDTSVYDDYMVAHNVETGASTYMTMSTALYNAEWEYYVEPSTSNAAVVSSTVAEVGTEADMALGYSGGQVTALITWYGDNPGSVKIAISLDALQEMLVTMEQEAQSS